MICQRCHARDATVQVDATVDGDTITLRLCRECATSWVGEGSTACNSELAEMLRNIALKALGVVDGKSVDDNEGEDEVEVACPECGLSLRDFRNRQRLGCEQCYLTFRADVEGLIAQMHRGTTHRGRTPDSAGARPAVNGLTRAALSGQLAEAIAEEAFERAAAIRDALTELDASSAGTD